MKKFCNKISKQPWRVSVQNLNTSIFRRSASSPDGKSDNEKSEKSYTVNEDESENSDNGHFKSNNSELQTLECCSSFEVREPEYANGDEVKMSECKYSEFDPELGENSGKYLTIDSANRSNKSSLVIFESNEETDSDQESRYEDASPMYEKKIELFNSNEDLEQNLYADIENTLDTSKPNSPKQYEYDVPKISFSFFEDALLPTEPSEDYEVLNIKPRSSTPKLKSEVKIVLASPSPTFDQDASDLTDTTRGDNKTNDPRKVENNKRKMSKTDTSENLEEKLPKDLENTTEMSNQDDVSIAETKCEISDQKTVEFEVTRLSFSDFDQVALTNLLSISQSSIELRENNQNDDDELYKVPTKPYKRLSQSLSDFNTITDSKMVEIKRKSGTEQISRSQIIQHNVILVKVPSEEKSIDDISLNLDYCNTRSKLPVKIRRATLLRRPQMRLKTPEGWNNFRSRVSNIIATHSAAQRVGANSQHDKVINLDQFYKNSRSKCRKFVDKTGKIFGKKRGQENVDPNCTKIVKSDSFSDNSSQIVKNDAFFDKVHFKDDDGLDSASVDENDPNDKCVSRCALSSSKEEDKNDFDFSTLKSAFRRSRIIYEGQNGFDDLRKFVKHGGDFCKELSAILQERAEAELQYAKTLSKLSAKLSKACRDGVGGINEGWKSVASDMESRSEVHRQFSSSLCDDIVKPLRQLTEVQHKQRKLAEGAVDKTARGLSDWRAAEAKSKKQSHQCARDNEKLQDALLDVRLSRSTSLIQLAHMHNHKALSDKESAKLEGKKRKAEDAVKKADIEYYTLCVRAERARLEWESAVLRGSKTFQSLEEERLNNLQSILSSYLNHSSEMCPKLLESTEKLRIPISESEPSKDMSAFINLRNTSQHVSEQLLPDFYCEHITLAMNRERRKQALVKLLHLIRQDLERERKSKNGLENLSRAIKQTPNFGAEDSQQNVTEKLYHMRSMLTYLEGARYKVQSALAELENRQRTSHPLASHITITRDKSGLQQSVLKVPQWLREEFIDHDEKTSQTEVSVSVCETTELPDWTDRGMADGNSNQHDSDFDEFSSQGSSVTEECHNVPLGQCKALYVYTANLPDELNLNPGDILSVYRKQDDGWWLGECNGCVGIFPATYVENV